MPKKFNLNLKKQNKNTVKKNTNKKKTINTICIVFLSLVLVGSVSAFAIIHGVLAKRTFPGLDKLEGVQSSRIYDRNGDLVTALSTESGVRENVSYDEIPQVVIDAFVSIEDSRFFEHNGFDFPRFLKSLYENVKAGGIRQGGSTLTMQLVDVSLYDESEKITFGTKEKLEQKIQEIFKSMEIESMYSKKEIIEKYLNMINFGGTARGIQKGAQYYFGKNIQEVTLGEAAFLAGVINAPNYYNPYYGVEEVFNEDGSLAYEIDHYALAIQRRNDVLYQMLNHGYIDKNEYNLAKSQELAFLLNGHTTFETQKQKAFIDYVVREVIDKTGENPYEVPMDIYTTMDPDAQATADALCDGEGITWPDELFQTGFAAIDNQTGEILALGGGRGYDGTKDRATIDRHQIGSTAKPLIDYAPAFEHLGYSTEHTLLDAPVPEYANGTTLYNADRTFRGEITLKTAVGLSLNVPAYKTLVAVTNEIGKDGVIDTLNKLGLDISLKEWSYGLSIGGGNFDTTPLQLAGAYGVFANKGNYIEPYAVTKIDFIDSKIDDYEAETEKQRVFSEETAYLMSYLLKDAVDNGSYQTLVNSLKTHFPVYGKSGTTDLDAETAETYGYPAGVARDKWMVGYTTKYTVACWAGYDQLIANSFTYLDNYKLFANIEGTVVRTMLEKLSEGEKVDAIARPEGVVNIKHVKGVFPYVGAADTVSDSMMVTGLINKEFATLGENITPDKLEDLKDMDIEFDNNKLTINFTPFSDPAKLENPKGTVTVAGKEYKVFFDKAYLFGKVQYKYNIYVNGVKVVSGASNKDSITEQLDVSNGDEIMVEGWYGYENATLTSNVVTKDTKASGVSEEEDEVTVVFDTNGGVPIAQINIPEGTQITLPTPQRNGFNFVGWYLDARLRLPYEGLSPVSNNLTLYAKWQKE